MNQKLQPKTLQQEGLYFHRLTTSTFPSSTDRPAKRKCPSRVLMLRWCHEQLGAWCLKTANLLGQPSHLRFFNVSGAPCANTSPEWLLLERSLWWPRSESPWGIHGSTSHVTRRLAAGTMPAGLSKQTQLPKNGQTGQRLCSEKIRSTLHLFFLC